MARVDYEEVVRRLERALVDGQPSKTSWGVRELRLLLADLRIDCELPEAPADRLFRLYAEDLADLFFDRVIERGEADSSTQGMGEDADGREPEKARKPVMPSQPDHREAAGPEGDEACLAQEPPPPQSRPSRAPLRAVTT